MFLYDEIDEIDRNIIFNPNQAKMCKKKEILILPPNDPSDHFLVAAFFF